jgi:hypothetical protein
VVIDILNDSKLTAEQKVAALKIEYDRVVRENCWLMTKVTRLEASIVLLASSPEKTTT